MNLCNGLVNSLKNNENFEVFQSIMKRTFNKLSEPRGFSLAEVLTALVIASMVLVAVLGIYSRAESVSSTITRSFEYARVPNEVLQRIAEDLDRMIDSDASTKVTINNKFVRGYPTAQLTITKTIVDSKKSINVLERIIWQTNYDYDANGLILYRMRTSEVGLLEDKLLDAERESWEQELFIPICEGITFFKVQVLRNEQVIDKWDGKLPPGIEVVISFAEPFKTIDNTWDVYEEQKFRRIIAVDRTRKLKLKIERQKQTSPDDLSSLLEDGMQDPNGGLNDAIQDPNS